MDISKYLPVGQQDAIDVTILASGNSLTGLAWRESNTSTEASIRVTGGLIGKSDLWVIADTAITAMTIPPSPPPES